MACSRKITVNITVFVFLFSCVQRHTFASRESTYSVHAKTSAHDDISVIALEEGRYRRQATSGPTSTTPAPPAPMTTTKKPPITTPFNFLDANILHFDHTYYNSTIVKMTNLDRYWVELTNVKGHVSLSNSHRTAVTATLPFQFPFYGHVINNVTIATGGFLYMSPFLHQWLTATQYIAPLMANFDTSLGNQSEILSKGYDTKFVVEWKDVHLQDQNATDSFRFQVILHNNGSIFFVYKKLPLTIQEISSDAHPVKIGLSDAFYFDEQRGGQKRRTIYEYHRVTLNTTVIQEGTVIMIHPLPTCNKYSDCETCVSSKLSFECRWCGIVKRCSDGIDWYRQQWVQNDCINLSGSSNCSQIPTRAPSQKQQGNDSGAKIGIIIVVVVIIVALLGSLGGWFFYAYTHPTSASGMWLMEHRPSQMKAKMNNMKFWKRNGSAGDKYAVESTA